MSNHSGSYMLNSVICILKDMGVFETIGREKTLEFIHELLKLGSKNDCNDGEILEDMDELGICYSCLKETDYLEDGLCTKCREAYMCESLAIVIELKVAKPIDDLEERLKKQ